MAFAVDIDTKDIFPKVYLKDNERRTTAEIYAFGALLNGFIIEDLINVIDGFTAPEQAKNNIKNGFKSAKLSPYVCRITNGEYIFNKTTYKLNKFFLKKEAIHGLLFDALFTVADSGTTENSAYVTMKYKYIKEDAGFPFHYTCMVKYELKKNNQLTIETTVQNDSAVAMPVCDGWHPYFKLDAVIDELTFQLNAEKMLEFNERLVPNGEVIPYKKFQQPSIFGNTFLDNCFILNENDLPSCTLKNKKTGFELTITANKSYPYLQIYTPEHRNSIAIENLSSAPDAFNNKTGLKILNPQEVHSFKTTFSAQTDL